ncbi:MAG TPA: hypothetical protein VG986_15405 [Pseudolabrys sp.]|nr:hypothetical protein [Pseudolabrys sp.]
MKMTLCAGAVALAMTGLFAAMPAAQAQERAATTINVGRIKSVLNLRADQQPYWPAVERALREIAGRQAQAREDAGLVRRISRKVVSIVLDSAAIQRLASAARPLIATLDSQQMQAARGLCDEMGLGPVVAALH